MSGRKGGNAQQGTTMETNCSYVTRTPLLLSKNTIKTSAYLVSTQASVFGIWYLHCSHLTRLENIYLSDVIVNLYIFWSLGSNALPEKSQLLKTEEFKRTLNSFHFIYNLPVHNVTARWSALRCMHEKPAWATDYRDLKYFYGNTEVDEQIFPSAISHLASQ